MAKKKTVAKPVLNLCATLGSFGGSGGKNELSSKTKVKKIKEAGFTGRITMDNEKQVTNSGLIFACTTNFEGIKEIKPKLRAIKRPGARVVTVQMA